MRYHGTINGFNYDIEKATDEEFKKWLKAKLERYVFNNTLANEVVDEITGIKTLKEKVAILESKNK